MILFVTSYCFLTAIPLFAKSMSLSRLIVLPGLALMILFGLTACATSTRYANDLGTTMSEAEESVRLLFFDDVHAGQIGPQKLVADLVSAGMPPKILMTADIGQCGTDHKPNPSVFATAELLEERPGLILLAGDIAYPDGRAVDFSECYDPAYGPLKKRILPAPGNHEYRNKDAAAYFQYFGAQAGQAGKGWYSVDFAGWHIIALNSNLPLGDSSPQLKWLQQDLAHRPPGCLLAFWHHPRFSSGEHGNTLFMDPAWQTLVQAGADLILTGHDHDYERFAPMNAFAEEVDTGTREFVVGTGGALLRAPEQLKPNSEVRDGQSYGILELQLRKEGYDWRFLSTQDAAFEDQGSGQCHPQGR